ncbi:hypothetical protein PTTG_02234 [Puccinia triticina 1-1 BBBD Race 1]|uniref:Defect at low temperature protein 1 n=2 Tax=Puccinia triticina TaxID=208348 RepID=A0A180GJ64_PUCT1|nr:uncharacterized protein PtA15_5A17 [Puccinia triticina]OAV92372.1 hypothetical protein PTTG_02234 [Puccinia triticina 1-1 BBBD Race 1]WAQ84447.1 hypothetical protein PtA15_5A17 [Puccinia triticina]WAR57791.1 hypothetical protein PtB15_5B21 [Puccinia triticina]
MNLHFVFFVLLSLAVAALCLFDIIRQTASALRPTAIQLTAIALGSCFLVLVVSFFTSLSRYLTVKHALALIPKPYIPISQLDLPRPIAQTINQEYARIAIIAHLASKPDNSHPHQRGGLAGWGKPGTIHQAKRFSDQILKDFASIERALDGLLPTQPKPPIPTRQSATLDGPLTRYLDILTPSSPTQPTPILLTPPQKLILNRYALLIQKSLSPTAIVSEADYQVACKCLVILVDQIQLSRSPDWSNPEGFGPKGHPLYQGIRFKDAIIETAIKLEKSLAQKLMAQSTKPGKPSSLTPPSTMQTSRPGSGMRTTVAGGGTTTSGKEAIENLLKKIFPLIYPPFLPSAYGPIITGYEALIRDISFIHPHLERSLEEYEYALRCIGSLISHVHKTL